MPANRQNKKAAKPVSAEQARQSQIDETIDELLKFRKEIKLGKLDWKALRDEGRR